MNRILSDYLGKAADILQTIAVSEEDALVRAGTLIAETYIAGKTIYIFGCTHSALLAEDVFYRAGAPCFWRPLWGPGMSIATTPGVLTTAIEHSEEVGNAIVNSSKIGSGDTIAVISTSGKNAAPVAVADGALRRGANLIVISSSAYKEKTGNHSRIKNLWAMADRAIMIDNHVPEGDASIDSPGCPMGPLSTIAGSFLLHAINGICVEHLTSRGLKPPVFSSSNTEAGKLHNAMLMELPGMHRAFYLP